MTTNSYSGLPLALPPRHRRAQMVLLLWLLAVPPALRDPWRLAKSTRNQNQIVGNQLFFQGVLEEASGDRHGTASSRVGRTLAKVRRVVGGAQHPDVSDSRFVASGTIDLSISSCLIRRGEGGYQGAHGRFREGRGDDETNLCHHGPQTQPPPRSVVGLTGRSGAHCDKPFEIVPAVCRGRRRGMNCHVTCMSKRENKSKPHDGDDDPKGTYTKGAARTDLHCSPTVCGTIQEDEEAAAAAAARRSFPERHRTNKQLRQGRQEPCHRRRHRRRRQEVTVVRPLSTCRSCPKTRSSSRSRRRAKRTGSSRSRRTEST
jgi:hypothetical protein